MIELTSNGKERLHGQDKVNCLNRTVAMSPALSRTLGPTLKIHRSTVLYCKATYSIDGSPTQESVLPVFTAEIGGIRPNLLLNEADAEVPFESIKPEMAGASVTRVELSLSRPDGTFATAIHEFGEIILVAWSEARLLAAQPVIDPDWTLNPSYIVVDGHRVASPR